MNENVYESFFIGILISLLQLANNKVKQFDKEVEKLRERKEMDSIIYLLVKQIIHMEMELYVSSFT